MPLVEVALLPRKTGISYQINRKFYFYLMFKLKISQGDRGSSISKPCTKFIPPPRSSDPKLLLPGFFPSEAGPRWRGRPRLLFLSNPGSSVAVKITEGTVGGRHFTRVLAGLRKLHYRHLLGG